MAARTVRLVPVVRLAAVALTVIASVAGIAACGGSGSTIAAAGATPTGVPTGQFGRGPGGAEFQKIQECLTAAGISLPRPSGTRSFVRPSGVRPSGFPSGVRPSGARNGFGAGRFADPRVRAALAACGIALPSGRPQASGEPTATPVG